MSGITFVREVSNANSLDSIAVTNGGTVAVGDLLVAMIGWDGTNVNHSPAITDTVNTGAWNLPSQLHFRTTQGGGGFLIQLVAGWIQCDHPGIPVVTATGCGTDGHNLELAQYTGFVNGPSLVLADITTTPNQGTSTSPAAAGFTNSIANELTIVQACCGGGQNFGSFTGSFTTRDSAQADNYFGDVVKATSGNALTFGSTITSNAWGVMLFSFQDFAPPPPVNTAGPVPRCIFIMP